MGKSSTTTKQSQVPPWVTGATQQGLGTVFGAAAPYTSGNYTNPALSQVQTGLQAAAAAPPTLSYTPWDPAQVEGAGQLNPATYQAQQLDPNAYKAFLNPYTREVVDTTTANLRDQYGKDLNAIRARGAAAHSFAGAGARAAFGEQTARDSFQKQVASTTAQLMAAGYDHATATAMANTQLAQQQQIANQQAQNQVSLTTYNADLQRRLANAGYAQQAAQANNLGMNTTAQANAQGYRQPLLDLLGLGQLQAQLPLTAANTVASALPRQYGSTESTTTPPAQSPLQTILGLGGTILGSFGGPIGSAVGRAIGGLW